MSGLNYNPQKLDDEQKKNSSELIEVEPWRMDAGKWAQFKITYRGSQTIICIREAAQSMGIDEITKSIKDFYNFVDLEKTAVFRKASSNDKKVSTPHTPKPRKSVSAFDSGLEKIGFTGNSIVYKERVIQILAYLQKRMKDESLDPKLRQMFTIDDVFDNVFKNIYVGLSPVTVKNKAGSSVRFMASKGWVISMGHMNKNTGIYKLVKNPYETEMPAQAEPLDKEFLNDQKKLELNTMREGY